MEDKRTAFAILLSIIIVMVYTQTVLTPPPQPTQNSAAVQQPGGPAGSVPPVGSVQQPPGMAPSGAPAAQPATFRATPEQISNSGSISIASDTTLTEISLLGGRVKSRRLLHYAETQGSDGKLDMIDNDLNHPLPLGLYVGPQSDELVQYSITSATGLDSQSPRNVLTESAQIVLTGQHPVLGTISKTIVLNRSDYRITVTGEVAQAQGIPISLEWTHVIPLTGETARLDPWQFTLLDSNDKLSKVVPSSLPTAVWTDHPGLRWFSFGDRYFTSALLGNNTGSLFKIGRADSLFSLQQTGDVGRATFNLYSGPKEKAELLKAGGDLKRAIDLGFFTFLADPLLSLLRFFNGIFGNYGIAIILLTLSVKLAFYPLTAASFKSMQKMQEIQPEMQRLREKHKDATELNQAVMELYKRKGVNPLGGCLPVLVQIPVFFGLYNALLQSIELRHQPFAFWIHDLSSPEKLVIAGIPVPLMIIIMGLTMIWQQWTTPSAADPQQKKIMMMMPVIFTIMFILFPMPAGLVLYWLVSNIMGITQQVYLRNAHGTHPLVATLVTSIMLFIGGYVAVLAT